MRPTRESATRSATAGRRSSVWSSFGFALVLAVSAPFLAVGLVIVLIGRIGSRRLRRKQEIARNRSEPMDQPLPAPRHVAREVSSEAQVVNEADSSDDSVGSNPRA